MSNGNNIGFWAGFFPFWKGVITGFFRGLFSRPVAYTLISVTFIGLVALLAYHGYKWYGERQIEREANRQAQMKAEMDARFAAMAQSGPAPSNA